MSTPPAIPNDPAPSRRTADVQRGEPGQVITAVWKRRVAVGMGAVLPGAGHLLFRRWWSGGLFLAVFGACFLTAVVMFLLGASEYFGLATSGDILEGDRLERIPNAFRPKWLLGLAIVGGMTWLAALIDLGRVLNTETALLRLPGEREAKR